MLKLTSNAHPCKYSTGPALINLIKPNRHFVPTWHNLSELCINETPAAHVMSHIFVQFWQNY